MLAVGILFSSDNNFIVFVHVVYGYGYFDFAPQYDASDTHWNFSSISDVHLAKAPHLR